MTISNTQWHNLLNVTINIPKRLTDSLSSLSDASLSIQRGNGCLLCSSDTNETSQYVDGSTPEHGKHADDTNCLLSLVHEPFVIHIAKWYTATSELLVTYVHVLFCQYVVLYLCDGLEAIKCLCLLTCLVSSV